MLGKSLEQTQPQRSAVNSNIAEIEHLLVLVVNRTI